MADENATDLAGAALGRDRLVELMNAARYVISNGEIVEAEPLPDAPPSPPEGAGT